MNLLQLGANFLWRNIDYCGDGIREVGMGAPLITPVDHFYSDHRLLFPGPWHFYLSFSRRFIIIRTLLRPPPTMLREVS